MKIKNALLSLTAIFSFATISVAQNLNVTLQAHLPYTGYTCANICGYVDTANNEYALVGSSQGLSIVNVTNPNTPISVFQHTGPTGSQALWQEIKVRGKYAYVTTEAGGGLQIFNLSTLPNASGITMHSYTGDGTIAGQLNSIHALHIEGNYAYLYGSNLFNGGAIAVNLTDPWNPIYEGHYSIGVSNNDSYVHDGYVRNDTLYAGHIYTGRCSVVDFTDKANPIELANFNTPNNFTHNTWLSSDSKTLFTTDEVDDSYLTSYDISDIGNITELDRIQSNPGSNSMVHNTHIISVGGNDYAVTSWYKDGFTIVDAGRPHNLIQVANYDTYSGTGGGSVGAWGVFPYFPSGTIVVSNINEGLFVFSPNYVRACYLEGNVTDSITGLPISNASIEILTTTAFDNSKLSGEYATGVPSPGGMYSVQYSKAGYVTKIISGISLSAGQVALQDVQLAPLTAFALSGKVVEQGTSTGIPNAHVRINSPIYDYQATADANGNFTLPAVYADNYSLTAGKWGFVTNCSQTQTINPSSFITIELEKGYYDDFTFNFNWTTSGSATAGMWIRDIPVATLFNSVEANPGNDVNNDCYDLAFVTGNNTGSASNDDVDNGSAILISPSFDLTNYTNPTINYSRWFFAGGGTGTPNDSLNIYIDNGDSIVRLEFARYNTIDNSTWVNKTYTISNHTAITNAMRLIVRTADITPGHLVEAGLDKFFITGAPTSIEENNVSNTNIKVYPNPFSSEINIELIGSQKTDYSEVVITDVTGRIIEKQAIQTSQTAIRFNVEVENGAYLIYLQGKNQLSTPIKIIKVK